MLSSCCKAPAKNVPLDSVDVCLKCNKACDLQPPAETHIPNDNNQPHSKITNKLTPEMLGTEHAHPVDETEKLLNEGNDLAGRLYRNLKLYPTADSVTVQILCSKVRSLESKLRLAVDGLEELSTLGNGSRPGNSIGNEIAQKALAQIQLLTTKG